MSCPPPPHLPLRSSRLLYWWCWVSTFQGSREKGSGSKMVGAKEMKVKQIQYVLLGWWFFEKNKWNEWLGQKVLKFRFRLSHFLHTHTGFIRGILRGVRYAKSLRVLFLHRRSPSWTTFVLYSRAVFIFNEPNLQGDAQVGSHPSLLCSVRDNL